MKTLYQISVIVVASLLCCLMGVARADDLPAINEKTVPPSADFKDGELFCLEIPIKPIFGAIHWSYNYYYYTTKVSEGTTPVEIVTKGGNTAKLYLVAFGWRGSPDGAAEPYQYIPWGTTLGTESDDVQKQFWKHKEWFFGSVLSAVSNPEDAVFVREEWNRLVKDPLKKDALHEFVENEGWKINQWGGAEKLDGGRVTPEEFAIFSAAAVKTLRWEDPLYQRTKLTSEEVAATNSVAGFLYEVSPNEITAVGVITARGLVLLDELGGKKGVAVHRSPIFTNIVMVTPNDTGAFIRNTINSAVSPKKAALIVATVLGLDEMMDKIKNPQISEILGYAGDGKSIASLGEMCEGLGGRFKRDVEKAAKDGGGLLVQAGKEMVPPIICGVKIDVPKVELPKVKVEVPTIKMPKFSF